MTLYGISGLGADKRVCDYLTLNCKFIPIEWIEPVKNETIEGYAARLSKVIDQTGEFGILGVSFGGLVAVEISKIINPNLTILISSAETKYELRPVIKALGKTRLSKLIPANLFDPPRKITHFLFGTDSKELLNNILDDTDLHFTKWAVNELLNWKNVDHVEQILKLSGTRDKLIPPIKDPKINLIKGGGHFIIVDKAAEISEIINERIESLNI